MGKNLSKCSATCADKVALVFFESIKNQGQLNL